MKKRNWMLAESFARRHTYASDLTYEKTLITPLLSIGIVKYMRHLDAFNFGVHNLQDKTANMCMWHEGCASRDTSEIGLCVLKYMKENVENTPGRSIVAFYNSCEGQNRNFKIPVLVSILTNVFIRVKLYAIRSFISPKRC